MKKRASILHLPFQLTSYIYKHKALITIGLFIFYMIFFDKFNVRNQFKIFSNLSELKEKKLEYQQMIVQAKADKMDLEQNFEKFAREKYHMSRKDEDVFIIETRRKTK